MQYSEANHKKPFRHPELIDSKETRPPWSKAKVPEPSPSLSLVWLVQVDHIPLLVSFVRP
jgi:hypothetical protein